MNPKSAEIAIAIVDALNDPANAPAGGWAMPFLAERRAAALTENEVHEAQDARVMVFTGTKKTERATRRSFARTYKPIVSVQRLLGGATREANLAIVDTLELLTEQIESVLETKDMAGLSFVAFDAEQDRDAYSPEAMQGMDYFAASINLEYTEGA